MYREVTGDIEIDVIPFFLPEKSNPDNEIYVFAYQVRITNRGAIDARLVSRHWIITDGNCRREEVIGQGVVGQQPRILPGQTYEYISSCPLRTPTGNMRGWYNMVLESGERLKVKIPLFFMRSNETVH